MPSYLAGRDDVIISARNNMAALIQRYPQQSVIYYGLRGVGKTVLLNGIEEIADELNVLYEHIEIKEKGEFVTQIASAAVKFSRQISLKEKAYGLALRAYEAIKSVGVTFNPQNGTFSAEITSKEEPFLATMTLSDGLTDAFIALGNAAIKSEDTIFFFIDEIQYLKKNELEALINAIHRINQKRLPIMIFGAGLPKVFKELGDAKSYSERLFKFEKIDALSDEAAKQAIIRPAQNMEVEYNQDAVRRIIEVTKGYPYFIQEFCNIIWDQTDDATIKIQDVYDSEKLFFKKLDEGFFKVRYERCTNGEKKFMYAMVKCGKLPCNITNVAHAMGVGNTSQISPTRAQLINKGLVYSTGYAELDFTVPEFDKYLLRVMPAEGLEIETGGFSDN
ncbi:MAG: ATP-binding protein [Lachnospiraceae bacterium]